MVIVSTGLLKCWNPNFPGVQFCTWPRWDPSRTEEEVEQSGKFQGNGTSWAMSSWPWFMGIIFSPIWGKQRDEKIFDQIARAFLGTFHRDPADVGILLGVLGHWWVRAGVFFVFFFKPRRCGRFQKLEEHEKNWSETIIVNSGVTPTFEIAKSWKLHELRIPRPMPSP